jgi:3-methyladenine DNA glycosylase AlkD
MVKRADSYDIIKIAQELDTDIGSLPVLNAPNLRVVYRKYTKLLRKANPDFVLNLAREVFNNYGHRWFSYDIIWNHEEALRKIGEAELIEFGRGIHGWGDVDAFSAYLAGPAWRQGQIPDSLVHRWARSEDRWWRRVALVSTVALNKKSWGGKGDVPRTLEICKILVNDKDDMVVKAMSWALRDLIRHDAGAVRNFLAKYNDVLAARVKREVNNKLTTGLKNPKRKDQDE